jgi:hypothetical protein
MDVFVQAACRMKAAYLPSIVVTADTANVDQVQRCHWRYSTARHTAGLAWPGTAKQVTCPTTHVVSEAAIAPRGKPQVYNTIGSFMRVY